ncbi:HugZ family pyridoxamine 5'-phosphate oxidase [Rhodalgimonas zhirmunskyi]|uniref:Pyridoxamine 5'-phosphate oxidase family protein n=1 Tax=Rhodalgimonas zhirmunskyi TaxID=2964767 RepID=A0AAJ1UBP7_9RHOB|nr:pyridoxamine 5'-phosphate oxidase family protein [Rhodoalgimonas zhirmunskyi]MDQ2093626.1 pyridoxamine 5'-phosphate oxidase family protein [Rhodoalgimonas zhirmunskyi]
MPKPDTFQQPDDAARALIRALIDGASEAALATLRPETQTPSVTRIAIATGPDGAPMSMVSSLAHHTAALEANPACALLIAAPEDKGDAMNHARLTLHCTARLIPNYAPERADLRAHFLEQRPKSKLYVDFPDFRFLTFEIENGLLNGGFGKAYILTPSDILRP